MVDVVGFSALWLGILTSISPCPLATNVAAISFIGRSVGNPRKVLLSGVLYTLGRTLTYVVLGALLVLSLLSAPVVSYVLQTYINKVLGPLLILVGMFLLGLLRFNLRDSGFKSAVASRAGRMGTWGSGLLGIGFALAFCPVSAALFFGSLIPLALRENSSILLPSLYGVGTALPVVAFAVVVALSAHSLGRVFAGVHRLERVARFLTGLIFVGIGVYLTLVHVFGVSG